MKSTPNAKSSFWQRIYILALAFGCLFASVVACVTTPDSKRKQLVLMSESQMNSMGSQAYKEMRSKEKISTNKALTAKIKEIGMKIAKASGRNYAWEFTVFESKQINAFCLPGGKIGVYTGIVPYAKTNAGMAAIMGHEVAHATARHSNERVSQALVVAGVMVGANVALKDKKYRGPVMAGLGLGSQVGVLMPYGRKHESEADAIGLKFMAKAGYDPNEAVALWQRMDKRGGQPPEFLSTHPNPKTRIKDLQGLIPSVQSYYNSSVKQATTNL